MQELNHNGIPEEYERYSDLSDETIDTLIDLAFTLKDISDGLIKQGKIVEINGELYDADEYNKSEPNTRN